MLQLAVDYSFTHEAKCFSFVTLWQYSASCTLLQTLKTYRTYHNLCHLQTISVWARSKGSEKAWKRVTEAFLDFETVDEIIDDALEIGTNWKMWLGSPKREQYVFFTVTLFWWPIFLSSDVPVCSDMASFLLLVFPSTHLNTNDLYFEVINV